jgi:hypothetical protein
MILPVHLIHQTFAPSLQLSVCQPSYHRQAPYAYQKWIFDFELRFQCKKYRVVHELGRTLIW